MPYFSSRLDEDIMFLKASLGSKHILFSYFIITESTELKLSDIVSPGNSNAVKKISESFVQIFPRYAAILD